MYVNDNIGILVFDEDIKGNKITNEKLEFVLVKRENTNSFNKLTYFAGNIDNKNGYQTINDIREAMYIEDINDTNSITHINTNNYKMMIDYNKENILFKDNDGKEYVLPLNNDENTWFYKLLQNNTNL
ncbi:hypothetical protein [Brachyspira alvinipulli]|uniref:hypothetical protein n=1 Tax=Brachyspira alvinipulli TaxID=84379 RepID=UPI003CCB76A9